MFPRKLVVTLFLVWIGWGPLTAQEESTEQPVPAEQTAPPSERYSLEEDQQEPSSSSDRPAEPSAMGLLLRVGATLIVLIAVLLGMTWLAKRFWPGGVQLGRGTGPIRILARTGLPPRHTLYLIQVGERILLIGATGEKLSTLTEIQDSQEVDRLKALVSGNRSESLPPEFKKVFSGALEEYEDDNDSPPTIPESLREL